MFDEISLKLNQINNNNNNGKVYKVFDCLFYSKTISK